jgi:hypothetical protein
MTLTYQSVTIQGGDTLPALAAAYLGYQGRWREIAALNRLRAPFISAKPADWYGPPLSTGILTDDIADGDLLVTLPGERADLLTLGTILFLDTIDPEDQYAYTAPRIASYDAVAGTITLLDPVGGDWPTGARYRVCPSQEELGARVARPGEVIALPLIASGTASQVVTGDDLIDVLGTDVALTFDGALTLVGGDLATYSGVRNAQQGLWMRATMPEGESVWHPELGNRAYILIGEPLTDQNVVAAALYTRTALATDPRAAEIPSVIGQHSGLDAVQVSARVTLLDHRTEVSVNAILREGR